MVVRILTLLADPIFAESNAERRGKLIGLFLASVCILIAGIVLARRNRKK
ncbi:MAG: hypothetical protein ABGZ53_20870 [Fuerstiella sp.]